MDASAPLIQLESVTKVYTTGAIRYEVLKEINLTVRRGEYIALTGASGSGKSTLLNILGCLDVPTAGHYRIEGEEVSRKTDLELARIRNRLFGFVFQSFNLLSRYTAEENVALPMTYGGLGRRERLEKARRLLTRVGLGDFTRHYPTELSGGMQQRVAIARALANDPAVLFADEPTGNLDSKTGMEIITLFGQLSAEGATLIVVTHDPRVASHARRVLSLSDGRIIKDEQNTVVEST
ncbi:MAG: ABC transporter ATP-binding protein [Gammaproteobacteria bacterium]|nr:ABC transporter ATP-binding protein [Gammaproteobacteria bacterium]